MRPSVRLLLIVCSAVLLVWIALFVFGPIGVPLPRRQIGSVKPTINPSERCAVIRQRLLKVMPAGTLASQVSAFLKQEMRVQGKINESTIAEQLRLFDGPASIPKPNCEARGWRSEDVGSKNIWVSFESPSLSFMFGLPVSTKNVAQVSFAFDANDRLLDIGVETFTTGLP